MVARIALAANSKGQGNISVLEFRGPSSGDNAGYSQADSIRVNVENLPGTQAMKTA